ncbi:acyl-CoA dehydrogenase family protein [Streptomyces sp. NEAU-Y11]|uniref:acyl-CoA dehydrogenase family protein n=1 Tax=Streptomyces cucumeris TaxID=2962890 RepID=UPI0020C8CE5A|nr:acyl-CoA dehydrogenase family protein [Streptomyces sp. NEAU-Y11]MCP9208684.1 acyl-CoA/acyl-ACP dehydrogenase [Streptomyces sp. NEAU-Y11]
MDFSLTEDQRALRAGMRELMERRFPRARLRAVVDAEGGGGAAAGEGAGTGAGAVDRGLWRELGAAGFFALRLPEAAGGVGLGLPEAVLAFEEAGRALLPGPLAATHLAAGLAATGAPVAGVPVAGAAVAGAAEGEAVVTALDTAGAGHGGAVLVEHLASADAVLVLGDGDAGIRTAKEIGSSAEAVRSVDPATPLHRVPGGVAPAAAGERSSGEQGAGAGRGTAARLRREAALLTAAQQLGSAVRTVETAVAHARERVQFGRAIGAFQAVQHLCASMLVRAETARSVVYAAAVTEDPGDIAAAVLLADEAAVRNARDCLQVHGGMGFTWEADVHLHLKRAWVRAEQWQTAAAAEEELAAGLMSTGARCL